MPQSISHMHSTAPIHCKCWYLLNTFLDSFKAWLEFNQSFSYDDDDDDESDDDDGDDDDSDDDDDDDDDISDDDDDDVSDHDDSDDDDDSDDVDKFKKLCSSTH